MSDDRLWVGLQAMLSSYVPAPVIAHNENLINEIAARLSETAAPESFAPNSRKLADSIMATLKGNRSLPQVSPGDWFFIAAALERLADESAPSAIAPSFTRIGFLHRVRDGQTYFNQTADVIPLGLHETLNVYMKDGDRGE